MPSTRFASLRSLTHRTCRSRSVGGLWSATRRLSVGWSPLLVLLLASPLGAADRLILRNLESIGDRQVLQFDEDGVQLDGGRVLPWDQIERGRVSSGMQTAFDRMLADLGSPLYRIRQRLSTGDYPGLSEPAEALYPRYANRTSSTAYMVCQATMWARLAVGAREQAVEPFFHCYMDLKARSGAGQAIELPGNRRLSVDLETALTPELVPVWFDAQQAAQVLPAVGAAIGKMPKPQPVGARVYYATLALAAGQPEDARQALAGLDSTSLFQKIVQAEKRFHGGQPGAAVALLADHWGELPAEWQSLALYWLGRARLASADEAARQQGLLDLLRIAAEHGRRQPELAAAGLHEVMLGLAAAGNTTGSIAVRRELLDRYGQTWHARQVRSQDNSTKDKP